MRGGPRTVRSRPWARCAARFWVAAALAAAAAPALSGQEVGREAAEALTFPPLRFDPPEPALHEVRGVPVLYLHDPSLPLVSVYARFKGGYARLGRDRYAAGMALPTLLRYGGTATLSPDTVDARLEYYAIQTSFGGGGESVFATVNTLSEHLPTALALWGAMMREPGFDPRQIEVWRGSETERVRRRGDDPARLAYSEFNRLLYGDHPVGWEMMLEDLAPERLTPEVMGEVHGRVVCPEHLTLGVAGDAEWPDIAPLLDAMLADWPPCSAPLPPSPEPDILREPGVWIIPRPLDQSVIVMAHPTGVREGDDADYFGAQIGNIILGAGGFSSRLLSRVRTEEGYAYSASTLWTTPRRYDGIVGAVTRTRAATTVPAIRLILQILDEAREAAPTDQEVGTAVDQIVNGFVFNFETPDQVVARRMFYLSQEMPGDWLERYLDGIQRVTPESVRRVFAAHLRPEAMTILVVGDPERIGLEALESFGPVTVLEIPGPPPAEPR